MKAKNNYIPIIVETDRLVIIGDFDLGQAEGLHKEDYDDVLLTILNSPIKFIKLINCTVSASKHVEYRPERVDTLMLNMGAIVSCSPYRRG